ncbi:MAG: Gfo/Idh/MocA family oxidoreductase [FCB group bacterium]|jgi:predicted dehydrogenase|nr:Gfo/Idh/MocA family oxidoreductase [FCB group bacterium]
MAQPVRVGIIGSGFIGSIHASSVRQCPDAELVAISSPTPGRAEALAQKHGAPQAFTDYRAMLHLENLDMVIVGAPNHLHCQIALDAAAAGKHVVMEKPMCLSLAEADRMIAACEAARVKLMYAEELCFAPKYVRMKQLLDSGALGKPTLLKQSEKHDGPHAEHFWDVDRSGGGVAMDMGCHAIAFFRWLLNGANITSVYAQMNTQVHGDKTKGEDNAILLLEFENNVVAMAEESWTKTGGMDDRAEIYGSHGVAYANLLQGSSIVTYSAEGYDYAVEKAGTTRGWSFTMFEEEWNYGFPQEIAHFVDCVQNDRTPLVTGHDGRAVLEALFAAYASAGQKRKIHLPFQTDAQKPFDLYNPRIHNPA